ncbi:hypothetical protein [Anabaena subtropica]|uniref:Uncharacterized protein n=1 Tax=Anabaena subtropica FACHB-260 TaxID=2692884 RepID=A0ABR8CN08_9NOST|nr:hypothetical protein [Anabaena subtropica]MBD2344171.1 hypothetical protein [Anabaena subtropica FACHB-260]
MSLYCEIGDKPKVIYRANGDKEDSIFYAEVSPIDVSVVPVENPNLKDEIYAWNFSTNLNPRTTLQDMPFRAVGKLTAFRVTGTGSINTVNGQQIAEYSAEFRDGNGALITGSAVGNYPGDTPKLVKILIPNEDKPPEDICRLEVRNTNGDLIFSASGKCPIPFKVACGNCPPGQIECKSNKYPGYCCIPCQGTAAKINNLAAKVRGK